MEKSNEKLRQMSDFRNYPFADNNYHEYNYQGQQSPQQQQSATQSPQTAQSPQPPQTIQPQTSPHQSQFLHGSTSNSSLEPSSSSVQPSDPSLQSPSNHLKGDEQTTEDDDNEEISLRILIPNNMVGSIIGKAGATIKEVTQQTGSKIHISQNEDSLNLERVVTITGIMNNVAQAQYQIACRMQEECLTELNVEIDNLINERMALVPLKILVPNNITGRLIGKSGNNLKKTMVESDSFITCSRENEPTRFVGERIVTIIGTVDNQNRAQVLISRQVKSLQSSMTTTPNLLPSQTKSLGSHYSFDLAQSILSQLANPTPTTIITATTTNSSSQRPPLLTNNKLPRDNHTISSQPSLTTQHVPIKVQIPQEIHDHEATMVIYVPNGVVGSVIGKNGQTVKDIGIKSRCTIRVARNEEVDTNSANRPVNLSGTIDSLFKAQTLIYAKIQEAPPAVGGGQDFLLTADLTIPSEMIGRVIGRKGTQIRQITEQSYARLNMNRDDPNGAAVVSISGRLENNLCAQLLIHLLLIRAESNQNN